MPFEAFLQKMGNFKRIQEFVGKQASALFVMLLAMVLSVYFCVTGKKEL